MKARLLLGFTLIELSIVLVIIGMLVGSIVIGSSLTRRILTMEGPATFCLLEKAGMMPVSITRPLQHRTKYGILIRRWMMEDRRKEKCLRIYGIIAPMRLLKTISMHTIC